MGKILAVVVALSAICLGLCAPALAGHTVRATQQVLLQAPAASAPAGADSDRSFTPDAATASTPQLVGVRQVKTRYSNGRAVRTSTKEMCPCGCGKSLARCKCHGRGG